jgi:D-3-phosphoglycerate dehydrogenase
MAALCRHLVLEPVRSYEFEYCGELAGVDTQPVRLAILQGLLAETSEQRVTPVNAPLIARERGMRITERTCHEAENYQGLLVIRANTADEQRVFSGTVLRHDPHIIQADNYWVDFVPTGPLLFTYHRDRPGMIGRVGMLLGAADVNISGMYVGRQAPRQRAMMVLTLDELPSDAVMEQIRAEPDIDQSYAMVL